MLSSPSRFVIERSSLNGTIKEPVVTSAIFNVEGLAVDWMGRNIYWTDEVRNFTAVCPGVRDAPMQKLVP